MQPKLVCLHTVRPLLAVFDRLVPKYLPNTRLLHALDEPLFERIKMRTHLAPEDGLQVQVHRKLAEEIGAGALLVTCSTVSPCVDQIRSLPGIQVFKIDEAMIAQAVRSGARIGLVATAQTTLEPTRQLLIRQAEQQKKQISLEMIFVPDAIQALLDGEGDRHDQLVLPVVFDLCQRVDVIVLAQASMARVLDVIPEDELATPVLSSPHLALEQIRSFLEEPH